MLPYFRSFVLLFLLVSTTYGQELIFENISNQLSIPSAECYHVMQDSKGYIWIGTEQGLIRYDGATTQVFDHKRGIPEKAVYALIEDGKGRMWAATSKNRILYTENGQFKAMPTTKAYQNVNAADPHITFKLLPIGTDLYINSSVGLFKGNMNNKHVGPFIGPQNDEIIFFKDRNELIFVKRSGISFTRSTTIAIHDKEKVIRFNIALNQVSAPHWRVLTSKNKNHHFFTFNNKLVSVAADFSHQVYDLPAAIISLYTDKNGGIWVGTVKNGLFYFPDPGKLSQPIISLNNLSVSGVCEDREQNIWCTTLEDGVFFSKSKFLRHYTNQPALATPINLLKNVDGRLFVSPLAGGFLMYANHTFQSPIKDFKKQVYNIFSQDDGRYFMGQSESAMIADRDFGHFRQPNWLYKDRVNPYFTIYGSNTSAKHLTTYSISYDKIFRHGSKGIELFYNIKSTGKCIEYLDHETLLAGCTNGLYSLHIPSKTSQKIKGIRQTVTKIYKDSQNQIWICTKGDGLYVMDGQGVKRLDQLLKIPTDVFYDMTADLAGKLWVGSNKGLFSIDTHAPNPKVVQYSTLHGLPSNEVYKVAVCDDQLFFSVPGGLASMPWAVSLKNSTAPMLKLEQIEVNDKLVSARDFLNKKQYNAQENNMEFTFSTFSYKNNDHKLFYAIKKSEKYIAVAGNKIILQNLKPDDYQLSAYLVNSDGVKSTSMINLNFTISKPFWQKAWFIGLLLLLFAGMVYLVRKVQIARLRQKEQEKSRVNILIAQSKMSALQARMNPHFIFNAINSIQNYIVKNQTDEAQNYLVKFSRLIRLVLQQSAEKSLSLQEELDTLKLYIELEKLRFKQAFDYAFEIADDIPLDDVNIPTMLIQPYVENAIWHGLMNLGEERQGKLQISMHQHEHELYITVADNGIGRQKAAAFKKDKNYVSSGMLLTEQRLKTLQLIFDSNSFKVNTIDLYADDGNSLGTKVEIVISLLYDYNNQYDE